MQIEATLNFKPLHPLLLLQIIDTTAFFYLNNEKQARHRPPVTVSSTYTHLLLFFVREFIIKITKMYFVQLFFYT